MITFSGSRVRGLHLPLHPRVVKKKRFKMPPLPLRHNNISGRVAISRVTTLSITPPFPTPFTISLLPSYYIIFVATDIHYHILRSIRPTHRTSKKKNSKKEGTLFLKAYYPLPLLYEFFSFVTRFNNTLTSMTGNKPFKREVALTL